MFMTYINHAVILGNFSFQRMRACKMHWGIVSVLLQYDAASLGNLRPTFLENTVSLTFQGRTVQGDFSFTAAKV
jgi:hypothetical protein